MAKLFNLARMTTATTGTGTITLGSAVSGYLTFALAGVANGDVVSYAIKDGNNSEIGTGTYTSSGTTLTRTVTKSTNANAAINLSGTAEVFITPRAEDIFNTADPLTNAQVATQSDQETATSTTLAVTPGRQHFHPSAAKAWVNANAAGTVLASYGVSSVSKTSTGQYTVNFSTAFSSANYGVVVACSGNATQNGAAEYSFGKTASQAKIACILAGSSSVFDPDDWSLTAFGDR